MSEHVLIYTLVASLVTAFLFGMAAKMLRLPTILGYLIAGIAIGPHTPGFVGNIEIAKQLAEIGIILLMFGVGLHFSLKDLLAVKSIAVPGALFQMMIASGAGMLLAMALGYPIKSAFLFGFSLSVASTIVLLRALEPRQLIETQAGRIAIGWLIIEDVAMVLALVMIPAFDDLPPTSASETIGVFSLIVFQVLSKIALFFVFMLVIGRFFLPFFIVRIARLRSPELINLGILAIALGFAALAYVVFDASFALGAFLAGMVLNTSTIGRKAAESSLPMRDAFAVLFFVSVGMLFEPKTLIEQPVAVFMTCLVIVGVKSLAAFVICLMFRKPLQTGWQTGWIVSIGLAQIGEFSFILGSLTLAKGLISQELYNLILAGAMLSIVVNAFLFRAYDAYVKRLNEATEVEKLS
jgi:CPA2 family monovalent cation:H+ antiporter-2